jgi:hypothetical protein
MEMAHAHDLHGEGASDEPTPPVSLCGSVLREHRHVCAFFNSPDDEYRVTLPFIREGISHGDKAYHLIGPERRDDHLRRLNAAHIDVAALQQSGQLQLEGWDETYFGGAGRFDADQWLNRLEQALSTGPSVTRFVAHMEWALEERPGVDRIIEYEARANYLLPKYKDPVICCYDLRRFSGDVVMDIMRTHPVVIIGGILQENPFFVPPDQMLEELRRRRRAAC